MTHPIRRTSAVCLQMCFHHFWVALVFWRRLEVKAAQSQSNDVEVLLKLPVRGQRLKLVGNDADILPYIYMIIYGHDKNHASLPKNHPQKIIPKVCPKKSSNQHLGHVLLGYFTGCRLSSPLRLAARRCTTEMGDPNRTGTQYGTVL